MHQTEVKEALRTQVSDVGTMVLYHLRNKAIHPDMLFDQVSGDHLTKKVGEVLTRENFDSEIYRLIYGKGLIEMHAYERYPELMFLIKTENVSR